MKKKRSIIIKSIIGIITTLIIAAAGIGYMMTYNVNKAVGDSYKKSNKTTNHHEINNASPISILLLGTDTGDLDRTYKGRTDSIMFMTLNPKAKATTLVSIPRDSMVSIPGFESKFPQKLNAAYEYGNSDTSIETISKWLNVPINYYATINMAGIQKIVDQIGGIDVVPPFSFNYEGASFIGGKKQHLNGFEALKFARMRYDDPNGDYGRQLRQRLVIEALLNKSKSVSTVLNTKLLKTASENVSTNFKTSEVVTMAKSYTDSLNNIKTDHLQGTGKMVDGVSYEFVPQSEKQRITDEIRSSLNLEKENTGPLYAGSVDEDATVNSSNNVQ